MCVTRRVTQCVVWCVWCVIRCVIRCVRGLLCRSVRFFIRFPQFVYDFIMWSYGTTDNSDSERFVRHGEEYDSTWEDDHEEDYEESGMSSFSAQRNLYAAIDMQTFRHRAEEALNKLEDLTDDSEDEEDLPNLQFYRNNKIFTPDGVLIEEFHKLWFGDYERLEYVHTYIQWLFPIQEKGMNFDSYELSLKEIKHFHQDEEVKKRLLKSYELMLDFYGINLDDEKTGAVMRAENWRDRFENLNRNSHNNLRITRILKCLGLLGFGRYQAPLVHFFLEETLVRGTLPRVKQSALDYFIFTVLDKAERKELIRFAFDNSSKQESVWCPRWIHNKLGKGKGMPTSEEKDSLKKRLMNGKVENEEEIESDTRKETNDSKSFRSERGNDENASGVCRESDKPASPILTGGNANTADTNTDTEAPSGIEFQLDHHGASIQEDERKTGNKEVTNTEQEAPEKLDANSNDDGVSAEHSKVESDDKEIKNSTAGDESTAENTEPSNHSTADNVAEEKPLSGREQQDQGDKSEQGNINNEFISQRPDTECKEEIQQHGSETPEDSMVTGSSTNHEANSAHYDADMNRRLCTESGENIWRNPHGENEQRNLDDKLDPPKKEKNDEIDDTETKKGGEETLQKETVHVSGDGSEKAEKDFI